MNTVEHVGYGTLRLNNILACLTLILLVGFSHQLRAQYRVSDPTVCEYTSTPPAPNLNNVGNFNGVVSCPNVGPATQKSLSDSTAWNHQVPNIPSIPLTSSYGTGFEWQCTEYAYRYYYIYYGLRIFDNTSGEDADQWPTENGLNLTYLKSGQSIPPRVGDAIVFDDPNHTSGHVGIVRSVAVLNVQSTQI